MTETPDAAATKTLTTPRGMTRLVLLTYLVQTTALFATEPHEALFAAMKYPSAKDCQTCHPKHYEEWSVSPHAYALISPVFSSLRGTIVKKTNGTSGDFYIRCHTPAGMNLGEPVFMSAMDRSEISREGVTGVTYRAALGQRTILRLNGFASYGNDREDETSSNALGLGGRIEFTCKL